MAKAINPRKLRPAEVLRLVNSTPRGSVLTEFQLRRHRNQAGYTIGDARTVDLFRYAAWLTLEYFKPKAEPLTYEEQKARQAERNAEAVRAAQDMVSLISSVGYTAYSPLSCGASVRPADFNMARKAASFRRRCSATRIRIRRFSRWPAS